MQADQAQTALISIPPLTSLPAIHGGSGKDLQTVTNAELDYQLVPSKGTRAFGPEEVALAEEEDDSRGLPPEMKALLIP